MIARVAPRVRLVQVLVIAVGGFQDEPDPARGTPHRDVGLPVPVVVSGNGDVGRVAPLVRLEQALVIPVGGLQDVPDAVSRAATPRYPSSRPRRSRRERGCRSTGRPTGTPCTGSGHTRRRIAGCTRRRLEGRHTASPSSRRRRSRRERGCRSTGRPTGTPCTGLVIPVGGLQDVPDPVSRDATPRCPSSRPRRSLRERGCRSGRPTCTPCTGSGRTRSWTAG